LIFEACSLSQSFNSEMNLGMIWLILSRWNWRYLACSETIKNLKDMPVLMQV
jgi:hypothetical protein